MKDKGAVKSITWILLLVFAYFYCGNTLFIHTHIQDGQRIVHSHPYQPTDSHTHSAQAFQSIASANVVGASVVTSDQEWHCCTLSYYSILRSKQLRNAPVHVALNLFSGRAPPTV